jgi:hypothetical protein
VLWVLLLQSGQGPPVGRIPERGQAAISVSRRPEPPGPEKVLAWGMPDPLTLEKVLARGMPDPLALEKVLARGMRDPLALEKVLAWRMPAPGRLTPLRCARSLPEAGSRPVPLLPV